MHSRFLAVIDTLDDRLNDLLSCEPRTFGLIPIRMPTTGVYLFSENDRHLYVGRSNRLRERYFLHCRLGSRQNQASFAYRLAREAIAQNVPSPMGAHTRAGLAATDVFIGAFSDAKDRIRTMDFRYVEEGDQVRQALLEAYCAIVLDTPYNDFDTH